MLSNRQDLMRLRSICPNGRAIATIRLVLVKSCLKCQWKDLTFVFSHGKSKQGNELRITILFCFDGKWKSRAGLSTRIVTIFAARCRTENISRSPTIKQIKVRRSQAHLRCRC
ncbi:hypothetical protein Plhal304r1_c029g0095781 [Plasmopara halstedii]